MAAPEAQGRQGGQTPAAPPTESDLHSVGEKALEFRRYVLRRAYATYYATWSLALFLIIAVPRVLFAGFGLSGVIEGAGLALAIAIGLAGAMVTSSRFRKETTAAALRQALGRRPRRTLRVNSTTLWWGALIVVVAFFLAAPDAVFYAAIYALLIIMDAQLYGWLRRNFQDRIPPEGNLAVGVYGAGAALSLGVTLLTGYSFLALLPWLVVIAAWLFCALYALRRAPEEYLVPPV